MGQARLCERRPTILRERLQRQAQLSRGTANEHQPRCEYQRVAAGTGPCERVCKAAALWWAGGRKPALSHPTSDRPQFQNPSRRCPRGATDASQIAFLEFNSATRMCIGASGLPAQRRVSPLSGALRDAERTVPPVDTGGKQTVAPRGAALAKQRECEFFGT